MANAIEDAMRHINHHVDVFAPQGDTIVPPLVFTRLGRGGKTTFLWCLFNVLKEQAFSPIHINFNGGFMPREQESQLDAVVRLLSMQLMLNPPAKPCSLAYDLDDLLRHIDTTAQGSKVVLLIDELNMLAGGQLGAEVASFLKTEFLDKAGRYLVFTSHIPLNTDEYSTYQLAPYFPTSTPNPRGVVTVHQPHSIDLVPLRAMPGCESLTSAEVTIYGGIPSLIYSAKCHNVLTPRQRFFNRHMEIVERDQARTLRWFISQVLRNTVSVRDKLYTQLFSFSSMPTVNEAWWPLCYVSCILGLFPALGGLRIVFTRLVEVDLQAAASRVCSGVDWELIVQAALILRCIDAMVNGTVGPFGIAERGVRPDIEYHTLVGEITTLDLAHTAISYKLNAVNRPTILMFSCSCANFPEYDGFIAYRGRNRKSRIFGYQKKLGRPYPKHPAHGGWIERSLHLRGTAPDKADQQRGWMYLNRKEIEDLLGSSLKPLYPAAWPDPPAV